MKEIFDNQENSFDKKGRDGIEPKELKDECIPSFESMYEIYSREKNKKQNQRDIEM